MEKTIETSVRGCGILLHISSLPGPCGIGQLGPAAYEFLDFLDGSCQGFWQFLPLSPTNEANGNSPYMSPSAMAANPLFISIERLVEEGLLSQKELENETALLPELSEYLVDYPTVEAIQMRLLEKAWDRAKADRQILDLCQEFEDRNPWVQDYCLFMSLKEAMGQKAWYEWPKTLASREPQELRFAAKELASRIGFHLFCQAMFQKQWDELRREAKARGIRLFGDMPIYVSADSVDVWANQKAFDLDPRTLRPRHVAGVPPDYFSKTGQRWGNPLYKWRDGRGPNEALYSWWRMRFKRLKDLVDMVRIDHFRGFQAYWRIPAREKTAVKGRWVRGPGAAFFKRMADAIDGLDIVAEDLGTITPAVEKLRRDLGFPGMKVLQFAFDSDETNPYLPHNYTGTDCLVYTGTHDNATTVGWYLDPNVDEQAKEKARRYANSDGDRIHWDFIRMAYGSIASLAMVPMQDVLGFGDDCRMNRPAVSKGNWAWRLSARFMTDSVARDLASEARFYNRVSKKRLLDKEVSSK